MSVVETRLLQANHRWKVLTIGVAANVCFSMIVGGLPATAVLMRSDYHITNGELGMIFGMLGLGTAISELPWGILTDRWGDRPVLLINLFSIAFLLILMAIFVSPHIDFVPGYGLMIAGVLAIGLLGSGVNGSSGRAIMSWFQQGERGFAMSIRQTAVPMGYGMGAITFPLLATHYGFTTMYVVSALLCCVSGIYAWLWLHEPIQHDKKSHTQGIEHDTAVEKNPLADKAIWKIVFAIAILCGPQFALLTFGSVFLHDFGEFSMSVCSASLAVIQIGAMILRVWSGRWTDKHQNREAYLQRCSQLSILAFAALCVFVYLEPSLISYSFSSGLLFLFIMAGIIVSAWHGVAYAELATLAGPKRTGTAFAMGNTCVFIIMFITPNVIPWLQEKLSWSSVWLVCVLCACLSLFLFPSKKQ